MNLSPTQIELVPAETLNELCRIFEHLTGVPLVITDSNGKPMTAIENPTCFCGSLLSPDTPGTLCLRRQKWDVPEPEIESALRESHAPGQPLHHRCRGGFRDTAAPIQLDHVTIGYVVFARTLTAPPDRDRFRELAVEGNMPPEAGDAVAACSQIMAPERIEELARFLQIITQFVAAAAWDRIRAQQILDLEKLRDDLMHMIVHDLRTPLTSIIGGLQTVMDADYDRELAEEFIPMAVSGANQLVDMVSSLLDISKLESGQMTLDLSDVNLPAVVEAALEQVRGLARERNHTLLTNLRPTPPLRADAEKLRRVIINLLGNAVKFTPDGGTITVGVSPADGGLIISVTDTGPGIPAEYLDRIFDKFAQVENQGMKKNSTGLGLTFCKLVAEAHGGRIWVESTVGEGSRFAVFLPA